MIRHKLLRLLSLLGLVWIKSWCLVFYSPSRHRHIVAAGLLGAPLWVSVTVPAPFTRPLEALGCLCATGTAWGSFSRHRPSGL